MIDGLKAVNAGPLQSDSVAPIWREIMSACRALERRMRVAYLGPAGTFSEEAALGLLRLVDRRACPAPASTRCSAAPAPARPISASCRWRTPPKAWSRVRWTCSCTRRCSSSARPACSCATTCCAASHTLDGIQAVLAHPQALAQCSSLAQPASAAGRTAAGAEQRRGRAPGQPGPIAGCHRQRACRQRVRPARGGAGDPGRRPQSHPLCHRHPPRRAPRAQGQRATTAPAWWCRWPTGRAPCTTCWCR